MSSVAVDDFLLRYGPRVPPPVDPQLLRARAAVGGALAALSAVPDASLEVGWPWNDGEADVRYGFYRAYELMEETRARIRPLVAAAASAEAPARPLVAAATAARWELHGVMAGLDASDLDADPGNGEWTVRQTLAHIVGGQRGYGWFTAWWLAQHGQPTASFPARVPDELAELLPDESTEGEGSLADIGARLDAALDQSAGSLGALSHDRLAATARWSGMAVNVGFRLVRWASHMREHTIQLDKTLVMAGRPTSEVARLVRLIAAAYGRLEEELYMWPPGSSAIEEAIGMAAAAADQLGRDAPTIEAAATSR